MILILTFAVGLFSGIYGTAFLKRYVGTAWGWVIWGFAIVLCLAVPVLGLLATLALAGCGVVELHQRKVAQEPPKPR